MFGIIFVRTFRFHDSLAGDIIVFLSTVSNVEHGNVSHVKGWSECIFFITLMASNFSLQLAKCVKRSESRDSHTSCKEML